MKTSIFFGFLLFAISIIRVFGQAEDTSKPSCKPKKSNITYEDALFVFVMDHHNDESIKNKWRYVFKQIACEIPTSENLQTSILYYGQNAPKAVEAGDFVKSSEAATKLEASYNATGLNVQPCERIEKHLKNFDNNPMVSNRTNIKYIMFFTTENFCPNLVVDKSKIYIIFYRISSQDFYIFDTKGAAKINQTDANSKKLKEMARRIVSKNLIIPPAKAQNKKSESGFGMIEAILLAAVVIIVILLVAASILYIIKIRGISKQMKEA
ncbi:unnamed protein product [Caenorhabditis angaria]|uniref:VWFA domain-containing protein n=1 Tax=Caenorhabditis angaria TaxID=860376 RepID=A0A9P1ILY2_9PELO|nr:unnamed protein product [Caenorhabditis angaria]